MAKKHWIQGAIKHPGALKAAAKAQGKTITEYCGQANLSGTAKKRCALAKTLRSMHK
jgi:hypothetical protein